MSYMNEEMKELVLKSLSSTPSFLRWAKTGFVKSGRLNMWHKSVDCRVGWYAYNRETHQFFRNTKNEANETPLPYYEGSEGWDLVEEDKVNDGIKDNRIVVSVSKGDVAIRPLYYNY